MFRRTWTVLLLLFSAGTLFAQPSIVFGPTELNFGFVPVGTTVEQEAWVASDGDETLTVDAEVIGDGYSLVGQSHWVITPRDTMYAIRVLFAPVDEVPYRGVLHLTTNSPDLTEADILIPLTGEGTTEAGPGFALLAPPNGAELTEGESVTLVWQTLRVAATVHYTVHLLAPDSTVALFGPMADTTFVVPADHFTAGAWYTWWVESDYGNPPVRSWMSWFHYGEEPPPPPVPHFGLIAPANEAELGENAEFVWQSLVLDPQPTVTYQLWIFGRDSVSQPFMREYAAGEDTVLAVNLHDFPNHTDYVWGVKAVFGMDTVYSEEIRMFTLSLEMTPQGLEDGAGTALPAKLAIASVYPNPFNPETQIQLLVPTAGVVRAEVYDILGRKVAELVNAPLAAGEHRLSWRADGPSGLYLLKVSDQRGGAAIHKLMLVK